MRPIEEEYIKQIEVDWHGNYVSGQRAIDYINHSTAKYHGRCVRTLYMPKIFDSQDVEHFQGLLNTLYSIFGKIMEEYVKNPSYRKLFGFDERLEQLILKERQYDSLLPVARIDIFYHEETKDFKFCEFNTDGTSAMNEDRELNKGLSKSLAYTNMAETYDFQTFELFDSLAEELEAVYKSSRHAVEHPHFAIVDFMENATEEEFKIIRDTFEARGISAEICEIRNLTFDGEALFGESGQRIHAIYRRAVTCDIMAHYDEIQPFIKAAAAEKVCLLGDFRTQIVHNKILYEIVFRRETKELLTDEENAFVNAHFPRTARFRKGEADLESILKNKDQYIIKPEDSYGSKGVYAGSEHTMEEWEKILPEHYGKDYIVQEFCRPYKTVNLDLMKTEEAEFKEYSNITGMYVYNGHFKGIYSRISDGSVISTQYNEMAIPTVVIPKKNS